MRFGSHQFSGACLLASGILHALVFIFAPNLLTGLAAVFFSLIGVLLYRGHLRLTWLAFLSAAFGVGFAIFGSFGAAGWVYVIITICNLLAAASSFLIIWKRP